VSIVGQEKETVLGKRSETGKASSQVAGKELSCQRPKVNHPLLVAFPFHLRATAKQVKVTQAQGEKFRKASARVKGEAKESSVPKVGKTGKAKGLEGFGEVVFVDRFGQGRIDFWGRDLRDRVVGAQVFFDEPTEKGTKGAKFGVHGNRAVFAGEPPKEGLQVLRWASAGGRARKLVFVVEAL